MLPDYTYKYGCEEGICEREVLKQHQVRNGVYGSRHRSVHDAELTCGIGRKRGAGWKVK